MKLHKRLKADALVRDGLLVTPAWLMQQGMTRSHINNWLRSGQLVAEAQGVYRRPGPPLKWQAVIHSLQRMSNNDFAIGGLTALEMQGFGHYLNLSGKQTVHLYHSTRVPHWLLKVSTNAGFVLHHDTLFKKESKIFSNELPPGLKTELWGNWDWPLILSTPEQAALEVLEEVPQDVSFETANLLMQGLVNLSPYRLEPLLHSCKSVKAKRLFFWFAERQNHAWLKKLDSSQFDLGKGKRMLAMGGKLDKKYLITVPESLQSQSSAY